MKLIKKLIPGLVLIMAVTAPAYGQSAAKVLETAQQTDELQEESTLASEMDKAPDEEWIRTYRDQYMQILRILKDFSFIWKGDLSKENLSDESEDPFAPYSGDWYEKIAGRGMITVSQSEEPGKVSIYVRWPFSAAEFGTWEMTAEPAEDGRLVYDDCVFTDAVYDETGAVVESSSEEGLTGEFYLNTDDELCWIDDHAQIPEISEFLHVDR